MFEKKIASQGSYLKCDILEAVKKRFDKEGVVIPYPQTVLREG